MAEASSIPSPLDRIDRRILALLQRDGRLSNAELARKVNLSPASCHRRTQRLFADGFIQSARRDRPRAGPARHAGAGGRGARPLDP